MPPRAGIATGGGAARVRAPRGGMPVRRTARGRSELHAEQLVEIQRTRLLHAAVKAVEELGYTEATVGHITARARVSRRTFYELFANREACLTAMLEGIVARIAAEVETATGRAADAAGLAGLLWHERVRTGLWAILSFLDREPALARVCVVESARGGPAVLARREEILAGLAAVVDKGRRESARGAERTELTAEGLVGAAHAIVYTRLLRGDRRPVAGLLGELVGMIVLPYLGPTVARREQRRPAPGAPSPATAGPAVAGDPLEGVAMRLTYRTARVLESVAELSGSAAGPDGDGAGPSNREVAEQAGITDAGQVSKLLRRLQRLGLLANSGDGHARGEPNAWALTPRGERVTQSICTHRSTETAAA
jgi:AcrR family transcriptional regulator